MAKLFPSSRILADGDTVRQDEYDVLITGKYLVQPAAALYVVAIGSGIFDGAVAPPEAPTWHVRLVRDIPTHAEELYVPEDVPAAFRRLVTDDLIPAVTGDKLAIRTDSRDVGIGAVIRPILMTTEPTVLAGTFDRFAGSDRSADSPPLAQCLILPAGVDVVAWVAGAVELWRERDATRFPSPPAWEHTERWRTIDEDAAAAECAQLESEREAFEREWQARSGDAISGLGTARARADAGRRRLLTAQGPDLVEAVIEALETVGFAVTDMDDLWPLTDRREDLRIQSPDDDEWIALAEVKGFNAGAQQRALINIAGRFVPRYLQDEKQLPSAAWYIANHDLKLDPDRRPRILAGNNPEIETFADGAAPGAVIDTITLFDLVMSVERGTITAPEARALLVRARGLFTFPEDSK